MCTRESRCSGPPSRKSARRPGPRGPDRRAPLPCAARAGTFPALETDFGEKPASGCRTLLSCAGVPAPTMPFPVLAVHSAVGPLSAPGAHSVAPRLVVVAPALTVRSAVGLQCAFAARGPTLPVTDRVVAAGVDAPARIAWHHERALCELPPSPGHPPVVYDLLPGTPSAGGAP